MVGRYTDNILFGFVHCQEKTEKFGTTLFRTMFKENESILKDESSKLIITCIV